MVFVDNALIGADLRDKVKIGASGKVVSAYDIVRLCALGADWINMARPFMFALGCIQARDCASGRMSHWHYNHEPPEVPCYRYSQQSR